MSNRRAPFDQNQGNRDTENQRKKARLVVSLVPWFSGSLVLSLTLAAVLGVQAPSKLAAQEATRILTLDQAVSIAMERNRDVQRAEEYQKWVRGKYVEERAAALPQLSLTAYGTRNADESLLALYPADLRAFFPATQDLAGGEISLSQALYTWGQVGAAIRAAKEGIADASDRLEKARQDARRDVTASFYDVLLAKEILAIARENFAQKERHLDEAQKRFALGTATDYDVLAARVAVENARPAVIRSANDVRTAREKLRFLLADPATDIDVDGSLGAEPSSPPAYDEAVAAAFAHRPDLRDLEHQTAIARHLVTIAKAGDKPRLDLQAGYGRRQYWIQNVTTQGDLWNAGLYVRFPFFDGLRTKGRVMQAVSDRTSLEIQTQKVRDSVSLEVRVASDAMTESAEVVKALSGTVEQAERLLGMAERGFEYGVKTKLDVDDAQLSFMQARGNLARARRDYLVARVNLLWVQGLLTEEVPAH